MFDRDKKASVIDLTPKTYVIIQLSREINNLDIKLLFQHQLSLFVLVLKLHTLSFHSKRIK